MQSWHKNVEICLDMTVFWADLKKNIVSPNKIKLAAEIYTFFISPNANLSIKSFSRTPLGITGT